MFVDVLVKPGSKHPGISKENGEIVVRVREPAIEGAANEACARALAAEFAVARSAVELVRGARARRKRFAVRLPSEPEAFAAVRRKKPAP
ncbi:MAG TPA: DUF167 domain-containing protein [Candidatus Baltobacteraceae bacterium]|nr:DUF167 domain-containing protein [Candidatus Baltobacteraceae bacterium]